MINTHKEDRRIRKTKSHLRKALSICLQEKPIHKITVKELCDIVDINRATFYAHYEDVYDLLRTIENDMVETYSDIVSNHLLNHSKLNVTKLISEILTYIDEERELCKAVLCHGADTYLLHKTESIFHEYFHSEWNKSYSNLDRTGEYAFSFIINGCYGIIRCWLNENNPATISEVSELLNHFICRGLTEVPNAE